MVLAIISALFCVVVAVIMFTPFMRQFNFYQPLAVFFMFEAVMILFDYVYKQISPFGVAAMYIRFVGYMICCIFFIIKFIFINMLKNSAKK